MISDWFWGLVNKSSGADQVMDEGDLSWFLMTDLLSFPSKTP
jgi:hypothetical protein